jgi:hypothetical protein
LREFVFEADFLLDEGYERPAEQQHICDARMSLEKEGFERQPSRSQFDLETRENASRNSFLIAASQKVANPGVLRGVKPLCWVEKESRGFRPRSFGEGLAHGWRRM